MGASFYGMQTMLVLYMVGELLKPGHAEHVIGLSWLRGGFDQVGGALSNQAVASLIFGLYSGLAYFLPDWRRIAALLVVLFAVRPAVGGLGQCLHRPAAVHPAGLP